MNEILKVRRDGELNQLVNQHQMLIDAVKNKEDPENNETNADL